MKRKSLSWFLLCVLSVAMIGSPLWGGEHKLEVLKFYNKKGDLMESISCYTDEKGRMIKHGVTVRYFSFGRQEIEYEDGIEVKRTSFGNER